MHYKHNHLLLFAIALLLANILLYSTGKETTLLFAKETFDFSLETLEGETVQLKDYRGKKVVHLVFWSTWCPKCLLDMGKLKELLKTIDTSPYEILAINVGLNESKERIKKIRSEYQIPFRIVLDKKGKVTRDFGVMSIPFNIIIDKEGAITNRFIDLPKDPESLLKELSASHFNHVKQ
jgi:peroxiredoxin